MGEKMLFAFFYWFKKVSILLALADRILHHQSLNKATT
jgi:hypothetical protein